MTRKANLSTTVTIYWTTHRDECDCDVEVDYTFDGEDLTILSSRANTYSDLLTDDFDDLVWEAVMVEAPSAYAEWAADLGEYLSDQAQDRRAAA